MAYVHAHAAPVTSMGLPSMVTHSAVHLITSPDNGPCTIQCSSCILHLRCKT